MNNNILFIIPVFMFFFCILGNVLKYILKKFNRQNRENNIQHNEELGQLEIVPQRTRKFIIKNMKLFLLNESCELTCSICLEKFNINDEICKLDCEHEYHLKCIEPWISININNNIDLTCPNCREVLEIEYIS